MLIVMMATGTRGDVQPMIALSQGLQAAGHRVRMVVGSNFVPWVEAYGLEAYPTVDMEALMQSEAGVKWVESTRPMEQLRYMKQLTHSILEPAAKDVLNSTADADVLIGGFVSEPYLQAVHEQRHIPLISIALQPYRASSSGAATLVPALPRSSNLLNRWMGQFAGRLTWGVAEEATNLIRSRLGLAAHTAGSFARAQREIPALYAISPRVVPPITDANVSTTGYLFLDEAYTPPVELVRFIEGGEPPVYVGFGSMSSSDPARTIQLVADALAKVGRRGVMARGWSGAKAIAVPDHLYLLDRVSHTWLFPQMSAVIHHGGAGTTAAGLRAGKPTLIIPHMADQPYWGRRVHELGVGVKAIPRHRLTADTLIERLKTLLNDREINTKAAALGEMIRAEHGIENAVHQINAMIGQPETPRPPVSSPV